MIYGQLDVYFVVPSGHPDWRKAPKKCDSQCFVDTKFVKVAGHVNYAYDSYARRIPVANDLPRTKRTTCANAVYV